MNAIALVFALAAATVTHVDGERLAPLVSQHVDRYGMIDGELAEKTGWQTLRGFRWRIVLVDDVTKRETYSTSQQLFATGQAFKIQIDCYSDLWIYVLNVDPDGKMAMLLPEASEDHLLVRQGDSVTIPPDGRFRFVDPPGTELFRIIASPKRLSWLNPRELLSLEHGKSLSPDATDVAKRQQQERAKTLGDIQQQQAEMSASSKPLATVVSSLEQSRELRANYKDIRLMPPPDASGQEVIHASADRANSHPIVVDVELKHR